MNITETAKKKLTKRELGYFQIMNGKYLVLMLKGKPQTAKSAILKSIADKLDMVYIDLRLPTMDEIDLGVYPVIEHDGNVSYLSHAIPEWARMTKDKSKNFLITFEEINRASKPVRDAALGILNERRVGHNFIFGDNVYMAATGNIGLQDGTDVEEFDTALKSRLITVFHDMDCAEWINTWAAPGYGGKKEEITFRVHPDIVRFLSEHPAEYYPSVKENEQNDVICGPRTWTSLSEAIINNFSIESTVDDYEQFVISHGKSYVGARSVVFLKFLNETKRITKNDVLKGKVKDYSKVSRENMAEVKRDLVTDGIDKLKEKELKNVIVFARALDPDVLTGMIYDIGTESIARLTENGVTPNDIVWRDEFEKEIRYIEKNYNEINPETNTPESK